MATPSTDKINKALAKSLVKEAKEKQAQLIPVTNIDHTSLAPWSVSKYKTLYKCPFQFFLRYILKLKISTSMAAITEDSVRTDIGKLAHDVLDHMMSKDIPFEEALAYSLETSKEDVRALITEVYWPMVLDLKTPTREFYARMQDLKRKYPVKEFRVEGDIAVDHEWNIVDFNDPKAYFRAKLDLSILMENMDVILLDHKLGGDPSWGLRNYEFQLDNYGALTMSAIPEAVSVTPGIHFIQAMDVKTNKKLSREHLISVVRSNLDMHLYNAIDNVKQTGYFEAIKGTGCKYCDYRDLCVKYRKPRDKKTIAGLLQPIMEASGEFLKAK